MLWIQIRKLVLGTDTGNVLEVGCSGLNTRVGGLMTVLFNYNSDGWVNTPRLGYRMHIAFHFDHLLQIEELGVRVLEKPISINSI